jgi:lipopolysaccharide assembly outer membrane protein LptD (OstA)
VAATERCRRALRRAQRALRAIGERRPGARGLPFVAAARLLGAFGGLLAAAGSQAIDLPEDRADLMYHVYDGGGVEANGPALLVRKNLLNKVSLSASYYLDMTSNASIDVVTTASPYDEKRNEYGFGVDYAVRDALISLAASYSDEPDYTASTFSLDVEQEVFTGMTSVSLGYTYASDDVGKRDEGFFDQAKHWRYRLGLTQILTPRWLASANFEIVSDDGYLGNPYRSARVFGAAVPERVPRTRTSRAAKFRLIGEIAPALSVRGEYRYFWDNWDITAHTFDLGLARRFGEQWLVDVYGRTYRQDGALFYFDNATTETQYVTRNRQLSTYNNVALGAKAAYTWKRVPGQYEVRVHGAMEFIRTDYSDFTDVRTGALYSYDATVVQVFVSANF